MRAEEVFQRLRVLGARQLAAAFGLEVQDPPRRGLRPCPACSATQRGRADRRPPAEVRSDGRGFRCFACGTTGDSATIAALLTVGERQPVGRWREVFEALERRGLVDVGGPVSGIPVYSWAPPPRQFRRPAPADVAALWAACVPVTDDPAVAQYFKARSLDPEEIAARELARALPATARLPAFARYQGVPWTTARQQFRIISPVYGATGVMESVRARALAPQEPNGRDKCAAPAGSEMTGLVLADPLGRLMLEGGRLGDGKSVAAHLQELSATSPAILVAEGEPDFWTLATNWPDSAADAPAVIGVIAGSWTDETPALGRRIPDGCRVAIGTHPDGAGAGYAGHIYRSLRDRVLAGRVVVERLAWEGAA